MDIWTKLGQFAFFESNRLDFRPFAYSDAADFYQIVSQPDNLDFIFPARVEKTESDYLLVHYFMKEPLGVWAICSKETGTLIGSIRFEKFDDSGKIAELGYFLRKDCRRQGLMTEAVQNLAVLAFETFGLEKLVIIAHKENAASIQVAQKAGFQLVSQFKGSDRYTHRMRDYVRYEMDG
ncbi:GNAT family N-acetyltransferase [Streptococcus dentiloxodontae]